MGEELFEMCYYPFKTCMMCETKFNKHLISFLWAGNSVEVCNLICQCEIENDLHTFDLRLVKRQLSYELTAHYLEIGQGEELYQLPSVMVWAVSRRRPS